MNQRVMTLLAAALWSAALVGTCIAQDAPAASPTTQRADPLIDQLHLSDHQRQQVSAAVGTYRRDMEQARLGFLQQMHGILTNSQYRQFAAAMGFPQSTQPDNSAPATQPAALSPGESHMPVVFSGGHDTVGDDRGRPVVLIAAGLGVPAEVFRDAFTHVHPAGPGEQPQEAQVQANKRALMTALSPYGVTDENLNRVSNYYRYRRDQGQMWPTTAAQALATVRDGKILGFTILNGGSGYSSPPQVSVAGFAAVSATASLSFSTDLSHNGAVAEIRLQP